MTDLTRGIAYFALLAGLILSSGSLYAQEDVRIKKSQFRTGIEIGFKEAWSSIKEGDKLYKQGKGTYAEAREAFLYANEYNPDNAGLNYKIGVCYLFTDDKYKAIDYLLTAYRFDAEVSSDINLLLGKAYHLVLEFEKASKHYKAHKDYLKGEELEAYTRQLAKRLEECQNGVELSREPQRVIIRNLGPAVNSAYDDYNPVFAYQDTALFLTSRRPFEKSKRNPLDNKFNEDIYLSSHTAGEFGQAKRLGKPFNYTSNDALIGISNDGASLLLYRGDDDGGDIEIVDYLPDKQKWSRPRELPKKLRSKQAESSASFSPDGRQLYYISKNEKYSTGGKDILVAELDEKGRWKEPRNIGSLLNTPYDEEGVFISPDGQVLYFASQGHSSMGGFDIFRSIRLENGAWSAPENLGYPINTPDDEVFYVTDSQGSTGYYSASREGGLGYKDIYRVVRLGSEKELITATREELIAGPPEGLNGFLTLPAMPLLDTSLVVRGRVLDSIGGMHPVLAKLSYIDLESQSADIEVYTDTSGFYEVRLPEATVYGIEINATGYLYFLDLLDLLAETGDRELIQDYYVQKIEVGTKVVLDNIYFETGKAVLRPSSFDALDQVLRFLENNPGMKIEISGHTDNTGSLRINQKLSRDRAKAVVDYLVAGGIPEEQLVHQGYADTQPVAPNDTSEGREKNRRVEFKVLSK